MIGLNRQIFRLNYVRTFFLSVSNTSPPSPPPETREKIKCLDKFEGTTKTKKHFYQMALVTDNVRVMIVQNELLKSASCSIRVGVGSEDDPHGYQGLAHLLEHAIAETINKQFPLLGFYCQTMNFETKFTFSLDHNNDVIRAWAEQMFSNSGFTVENMKKERNCLDNEFHEGRNLPVYIAYRTAEILKQKKDITLVNFGDGSSETLSQFDDDKLMEELEKLRKRYRERPLNVCVYSPKKIEMDDVLHSLDIKGSITEMQREEAKEPNWEKRLESVGGHHLVVQQSANDSIQLDIIYPFRKKLSLAEEDTFEIVGDLISESFEGQLGHVLFVEKMATACVGKAEMDMNSFVVTIRLTAFGLRRFWQVTLMVHDYFQFLRDNWKRYDECNYRELLIKYNRRVIQNQSAMAYADSIARCLGRVNNPFDEEDLFRPLKVTDEQHLISEQILNNKSIRYTIAARNETEGTVGTQFYYLETGLSAAPSNNASFTLPQLKTDFEDQGLFERIVCGHIVDANDEVMLVLLTRLVQKETDFLLMNRKLTEPGRFGVVRKGDNIICKLPFEHQSDDKYEKPFKGIDTIDFKYFKQSLMQEYSMLMTDSRKLARSLLETALWNITSTIKHGSVPTQYNVLKDMVVREYVQKYMTVFKNQPVQFNQRTNEPFYRKFTIKSINIDESLTVTLVFLQKPEGTEDINVQYLLACLHDVLRLEIRPKLNLYTFECDHATIGEAKGLLLTLVSVEEKVNQTGAVILDMLEDKKNGQIVRSIMQQFLRPRFEVLWPLWKKMTKQSIIIQIVGHEKRGYISGPFQTHFEEWFKDHEEQFEEINNL